MIKELCLNTGLKACVAFSRDFENYSFENEIRSEDRVKILWPYMELPIDPLIHQGSHMIHSLLKIFPNEKISIDNFYKFQNKYLLEGFVGHRKLQCTLFQTSNDKEEYKINERVIPKVNFIKTNRLMFDQIQKFSHAMTECSLDKALQTTIILEKILMENT